MNQARQPILLPRNGRCGAFHSTTPHEDTGGECWGRVPLLICAVCLALLFAGCGGSAASTSGITPTSTAEGTLYFGADGVVALHTHGGALKWHTILDPQLESGVPALAGEMLYVPVRDSVAALDAQTGRVRWRALVPLLAPDEGPAQLTVAGGMLYVGTAHAHGAPSGGALYALDARDGALRWHVPLADSPLGVPVVSDRAVYVADGVGIDTSLYAFRVSDGRLLWRDALASVTGTLLGLTPAVVGGVVYVGTGRIRNSNSTHPVQEDALVAFRASDGRLLWRTPTDGLVGKAPVVAGGVVYATSAQQTVYALDARDGTLRWRFAVSVPPSNLQLDGATPAVEGGVVYAGVGNLVYALDALDGAVRWYASRQVGPAGEAEEMVGLVRTLLVAGDVVYVGTEHLPPFPLAPSSTSSGAVYALRAGDEIRPLSYHRAVIPSSPLLLGGNDGFIYALKVEDGMRLWMYHSQEAPPLAPLLLGP